MNFWPTQKAWFPNWQFSAISKAKVEKIEKTGQAIF